jgi:hypothetical protein
MIAWAVVVLLVILAAACNAVMDKTETLISYNASVFRKWNKKFWCKPYAAHNVDFLPFTSYRPDAWHLAKSAMIVLLLSTLLVAKYASPSTLNALEFILSLALLGVIWNWTFNFFYWLFTNND